MPQQPISSTTSSTSSDEPRPRMPATAATTKAAGDVPPLRESFDEKEGTVADIVDAADKAKVASKAAKILGMNSNDERRFIDERTRQARGSGGGGAGGGSQPGGWERLK